MADTITYPENPSQPNGKQITAAIPQGLSKKEFSGLPEQIKRTLLYGPAASGPDAAVGTAPRVSTENAASPELQAVLDGLLFGFGDELLSGIKAASSDVSYEEALAANRAAARKFAKENPGKALSLELAGGLPYMFIPGLGVAKTASLLARTGKGALSGVIAGAAGGFGEGEGGIANRAKSALYGAAFGGALGTATPALGDALGAGYRKVFRNESFTNQNAQKRVNEALAEDGTSPGEIRATIEARGAPRVEPSLGGAPGQAAISRMETITDDAGPVTETLLEGAASRPSSALAQAERQLTQRKEERYGRVMQDAEDTFGVPPNYYKELDSIQDARRAEAGPLYKEVDNFGIVTDPAVTGTVMRYKDTFQKGWRKARELIVTSKDAPDELRELASRTAKLFDDEGNLTVPLTATVLDYLQRGVREFGDATKGKGTGPQIAKNYRDIQEELIEGLNKAVVNRDGVPVYKMARSIWYDSNEAQRALEMGKDKFMNMDPEEITKFLANKNKAVKDAFKAGAVRSIIDKIGRKSDSNAANAVPFSNEYYRGKIKALINATTEDGVSAADVFADLMRKISREKKLGDVENRVISGPATARRLMTQVPQAPSGAGLEMANTAAGGIPAMGIIASKLMQTIRGEFGKESDRQVAQMLLAMPMQERVQILRQLESRAPEAINRVVSRYMNVPGASIAGQQQAPGSPTRGLLGGM